MDDYSTTEPVQGSSSESFADAVAQALRDNPGDSHRLFTVAAQEVEEGGSVAGVVYRVTLNPQPLPPGPDDLQEDAADLNPQPLPPSPEVAAAEAGDLASVGAGATPDPLPPAEQAPRPFRRRWW